MENLSLPREDWALVAHELGLAANASAPPGLRDRIEALLADVPRGWAGESCSLEIDPGSAAVVRAILHRAHGHERDLGLAQSQAEAVAEAEAIVRGHRAPDGEGE